MRGTGGEHDGVEVFVAEQVVEVRREAGARVRRGEALARLGAIVAAPGQLGARQRVDVASEVRAPVAQADDARPDRRLPVHDRGSVLAGIWMAGHMQASLLEQHGTPAARAARDPAQIQRQWHARDGGVVVDAGVRRHDQQEVGVLQRVSSGSL